MDDLLLSYYERELTFIREMGEEFARKYPKIAGRLLLEADKCEDPHVERLIEAFAFISGRIHKKIDDDFPEITESLFNIVYPHYINPIPSMTVVKFEPVAQNISAAGYTLAKRSTLFSKPVNGTPCQFTTSQPLTLWPVEVTGASLRDADRQVKGAQQAILLQLKTFNKININKINWKNLRFYLNGQHQHVFHLYELLFNNVCHIEIEAPGGKNGLTRISLTPDVITSVGFKPDENIIPLPKRSFPGYLLLFEYFCFPEKFLFFDLNRLEKVKDPAFGDSMNIWIYLNRHAKTNLVVNKDTFCLNAVPAVNLFNRITEPVRVEHNKTEYRVIPDIRRQDATEIFSVDKVTASKISGSVETTEFNPFYSIRHYLSQTENKRQAFWHMQRRPSEKMGDKGSEVFLSFTDLNYERVEPEVEVLTIHATCTNRDLPARLPFGDKAGDFDLETAAPVARIISLCKPTPVRRPSLGGALQWRLLSHFSLNYLSIVEGGEDALREILKLYDFDNSPTSRQQINGIVSLKTKHVTKRIGQSFCRGIQVTIEFDEDRYVGTGLYLFTNILERFLGQYVSVNSFSQLIVRTIQSKEVLKEWPPRSGNRILL